FADDARRGPFAAPRRIVKAGERSSEVLLIDAEQWAVVDGLLARHKGPRVAGLVSSGFDY
ncbi:MAG TPA: hypothetical protein VHV78_09535, partial [Gemmatimonadaceae bacterium]|nr:hypothetical protein [Gemmatimonadaceae bacterium]